MAVDVRIQSGDCLTFARVNAHGCMLVAALDHDRSVFNNMSTADQAYHFYPPGPHQQFVITGLLAFATKDVSDASDTIIIVYETSSTTSTTVDKTLMQFGMGKLTNLPLLGLNLLVNEGKFLNAKTDDNTINMTIFGYYVATRVI